MDTGLSGFDIDLLPDFDAPVAMPGISAAAEIGGIAASDADVMVAIIVYGHGAA